MQDYQHHPHQLVDSFLCDTISSTTLKMSTFLFSLLISTTTTFQHHLEKKKIRNKSNGWWWKKWNPNEQQTSFTEQKKMIISDLRHVEKISEMSTEIQALIWLIYENIQLVFIQQTQRRPVRMMIIFFLFSFHFYTHFNLRHFWNHDVFWMLHELREKNES